MFERVLDGLPEMVRAARRLYDPASGGYHLPKRDDQQPFGLADVERLRSAHTALQYDCIETPVADLLASLVVNTRARTILETGTSRGFSTSHLAAAARCVHGDAARVVTLDVEEVPNRFFVGSEAARSIDARIADSIRQDPAALALGGEFDLLFLDSLHSYRHIADEIAHFVPQLKLGGLVVLHDTFFFDGLGLAVLQLMQHPALEVVSLPTHRLHAGHLRSPGVTLLRKVSQVAAGALVLPGRDAELTRETVNLKEPRALLAEIGSGVLRPTYVAGQLPAADARHTRSPALLDPAGAAAVPSAPAAAPDRSASPDAGVGVNAVRNRAFAAQARGDTDAAVSLLHGALSATPGDPDILCDLASLALATAEPVPAVTLARKALEVAPDHPVALYTLGMALAQGGAPAPAIRALQRVADGQGAAALRAQSAGLADQVAPMIEQLRARQAA